MAVPVGFARLIRNLNSEPLVAPFDESVWMERSIARLEPKMRLEAKQFIEDMLMRKPHAEALIDVLADANFEFYVSEEGAAALFGLLRKSL